MWLWLVAPIVPWAVAGLLYLFPLLYRARAMQQKPRPELTPNVVLRMKIPGLNQDQFCPTGLGGKGCAWGSLGGIIIHLNDEHEWTREQIADWLDTLDADLSFPI